MGTVQVSSNGTSDNAPKGASKDCRTVENVDTLGSKSRFSLLVLFPNEDEPTVHASDTRS